MRMIRAIHAGTVRVDTCWGAQGMAPFGGCRDSGFGRERGVEALDQYLQTRNAMIDFADEARDPFAG